MIHKNIYLFFILFICQISFAKIEVKTGAFYETNTFYSDSEKQADFGLLINPKGEIQLLNSSYSLSVIGDLEYSKYLKFSEQDFFEYDLLIKNQFQTENFKFLVSPFAKFESEPALRKSEKRLERQFIGFESSIFYFQDTNKQWIWNFDATMEQIDNSRYQYLENLELKSLLSYRKYFLPETYAAFLFRIGSKNYPDGQKFIADDFVKYNSFRLEPGFAVIGRLTNDLKIRTYAGFASLTYEKSESFHEPVFLVEFEEELSPKDSLLLGYDYSVEDSYYGNYLLQQKMYIGYARFLGDRILLTQQLEYQYKFFSEPYRRNDQRFVYTWNAEYSYETNLKFEFAGSLDLNSSDSFNNLPPPNPTPIDPSVSYNAIQVGFYLKYLL